MGYCSIAHTHFVKASVTLPSIHIHHGVLLPSLLVTVTIVKPSQGTPETVELILFRPISYSSNLIIIFSFIFLGNIVIFVFEYS